MFTYLWSYSPGLASSSTFSWFTLKIWMNHYMSEAFDIFTAKESISKQCHIHVVSSKGFTIISLLKLANTNFYDDYKQCWYVAKIWSYEILNFDKNLLLVYKDPQLKPKINIQWDIFNLHSFTPLILTEIFYYFICFKIQ